MASLIISFENNELLVLQNAPVHPGLHPKQVPFSTPHVLFSQLVGQEMSQLLPYTPEILHPLLKKYNKMC